MLTKEKKKLTIRVDVQLIEQAKAYAAKHNTSVSQLVESFFTNLARKDEEKEDHSSLVRQLTGILPADMDVEKVYHDYLMGKYG